MLLRGLIATQDPQRDLKLRKLLADANIHVELLGPDDLWAALARGTTDLLMADDGVVGGSKGIAAVRALPDGPEVVLFSPDGSADHRAELLAAGAFAVLDPTASTDELRAALRTLVERRVHHARRTVIGADDPAERLSDFATASPAMREFLALVRKVADSDSTLLIMGETGVGKEFLARAIHAESYRANAPFVAVNCSALSESLLESELFGHVEGAFTGAQRARRGWFELAHTGTLFLDEVGELSPALQVKLLRFLQDRRIQPVGSERDLEIDVRILAATNRDLVREREEGRFRADLFYRIGVVSLRIPSLRERAEDIDKLVESHVEHFALSLKRPVRDVDPLAMERLRDHHWPGNVRELVNVVERAVLLCEGPRIELADLPEEIRNTAAPRSRARPTPPLPAQPGARPDPLDELTELPYHDARRRLLADFELRYLRALLGRAHGRVRDAARLAGLNTRSLYAKMKQHGVRKESFKI